MKLSHRYDRHASSVTEKPALVFHSSYPKMGPCSGCNDTRPERLIWKTSPTAKHEECRVGAIRKSKPKISI